MCNVHIMVGLKDNLNKTDIREFLKMLKVSAKVNEDGWGIFNEEGTLFKTKGKYNYKYDKQMINLFNNSKFVIGHNRWATSGKKKTRNSHPFYNERFIWVHNGMIYNSHQLETKYNLKKNVDSELIGEILHLKLNKKQNLEEIMKEMFSEMRGSFSVFLFDKKTKKLYYVRHGLPFSLWLFKTNNGKLRIIGSTEESNLLYPFHKYFYGFKLKKSDIISKYCISDDELYTIDNEKGIKRICSVEFEDLFYNNYGYGNFYSEREDNFTIIRKYPDLEPIEENCQNFFDDKEFSILPSSKTVLLHCKKATEEYFKYYFGSFLVSDCGKEMRIRDSMLYDFKRDLDFLMNEIGDYRNGLQRFPE